MTTNRSSVSEGDGGAGLGCLGIVSLCLLLFMVAYDTDPRFAGGPSAVRQMVGMSKFALPIFALPVMLIIGANLGDFLERYVLKRKAHLAVIIGLLGVVLVLYFLVGPLFRWDLLTAEKSTCESAYSEANKAACAQYVDNHPMLKWWLDKFN